jgi:hypothetical protein
MIQTRESLVKMDKAIRSDLYPNHQVSGQDGFTATEVLVAGLLTSVVIGMSSTGILTMIHANARSEARSERRIEMNRALDFIADEAKTSIQMWNASATSPFNPPAALVSALDLGAGTSPELYLQIPLQNATVVPANNWISLTQHGFEDGDAVSFIAPGATSGAVAGITLSPPQSAVGTYRVYYIVNSTRDTFQIADSPTSTPITLTAAATVIPNRLVVYFTRDAAATAWLGPRTLNRATGKCAPNPDIQCPVLVDSVNRDLDTPTPNDEFTAEVPSTANNRQVALSLTAHLFDNSMVGARTDTLMVSTNSTSRTALVALPGGSATPPPSPPPSSCLQQSCNFTTNNGETTFNQSSRLSMRIIGGDLRCGVGGLPTQTKAVIYIQEPNQSSFTASPPIETPMNGEEPEIRDLGVKPAGTKITLTGSITPAALHNDCGMNRQVNSASPTYGSVTLGVALRNGDQLPDLDPFGASPRIDDYLLREGYVNGNTRTVTIAPNQVIYLFELGTTNPTIPQYDLQDIVAIATISSQ